MSLTKQGKTSFFGIVVVCVTTAVATWKLTEKQIKRKRERNDRVYHLAKELATSGVHNRKILDLRDKASFEAERIRGSHNIPQESLWNDNRWYELPEQHEPLLILLPPDNAESHAGLAKEFCDRRASGATSFLIASRDLLEAAKKEEMWETGPSSTPGTDSPWTPLFTPSPFLTRAVAALEPQLRHAWFPLTCIDIGCGAGRDAVWLAKKGWTVTALDCWQQALNKTTELARRMGVANSVIVRKGKVNKEGEVIVAEGPPLISADDDASEDPNQLDGKMTSSNCERNRPADGDGQERVIRPSTPASESTSYALVVAIRFLERSAFDTLARLVDPRGGYVLLSTFVEEEYPHPPQGDAKPLPTSSSKSRTPNTLDTSGNSSSGKQGTDTTDGGNSSVKVDNVGNIPRNGTGNGSCERSLGELGAGGEEDGKRPNRTGSTAKSVMDDKTPRRPSLKRGAIAAAAAAAEAAAIMARWPYDTPKDARKILRRGELARVFGGRHGFEILEDSVERLPDGRPIACFLARRLPLLVSSPSSTASSTVSPLRRSLRFSLDSVDKGHAMYTSPAKSFRDITPEVAQLLAEGSAVDNDEVGRTGDGVNGNILGDRASALADSASAGTGSVRNFTPRSVKDSGAASSDRSRVIISGRWTPPEEQQ